VEHKGDYTKNVQTDLFYKLNTEWCITNANFWHETLNGAG